MNIKKMDEEIYLAMNLDQVKQAYDKEISDRTTFRDFEQDKATFGDLRLNAFEFIKFEAVEVEKFPSLCHENIAITSGKSLSICLANGKQLLISGRDARFLAKFIHRNFSDANKPLDKDTIDDVRG